MTATELIDALHRAGATISVEGGKARMTGAAISPELKAAIKANREEVIAEWGRRQEQSRDRYAVVPSGEVPMCARNMAVPATERAEVMSYVFRQPRPVHAWVMARASAYFDLGVTPDDCEWRACVDLVAWQRATGGREAAEFVVGLSM